MMQRTIARMPLLAATTLVLSLVVVGSGQVAQAMPLPQFSFSTSPALYPAFSTSITDYVVRCENTAVQVTIAVPKGTEAEVNGKGNYTSSVRGLIVPLATDISFSVTTIDLTGSAPSQTYVVRCLPTDYPNFTSSEPGLPQAEYYLVMAISPALFGPSSAVQYPTLFDANGVPVWWRKITDKAADATILQNGDFAEVSVTSRKAEEYQLSGALTRIIAPNDGRGVELHELQLLPDGNYLLNSIVARTGVDLSFMGGPSSTTVQDPIVKEVTPAGNVVWSFDTMDHIPVTEAPSDWWSTDLTAPNPTLGYDVYHFNSAAEQGNQVLVSYRQLDAAFVINQTTHNIIWKLGGTSTPESLTFVGDPHGDLSGQHDARFYGANGITLHENGTLANRAPRAVDFAIDVSAKTATFVNQVTDPAITSAFCCGSARRLPAGDWAVAWGYNNVVAEYSPSGVRQFVLTWTDPGLFNYRAEPVLPGVLTRPQLRADMNAYSATLVP